MGYAILIFTLKLHDPPPRPPRPHRPPPPHPHRITPANHQKKKFLTPPLPPLAKTFLKFLLLPSWRRGACHVALCEH